jgi:hypothetical protein
MRTYQALACRNPARGELSGGLASPRDRGEQAEICCTGLAPMANPAKLPGPPVAQVYASLAAGVRGYFPRSLAILRRQKADI